MVRKKNGAAEARWRQILQRQAGSGMSVRGFCAEEGIAEPSFYAWRKKLRTRNVNGTQVVRNERCRDETADNASVFIPFKLLDTAATLEIVHPLGYRIQVTGDVNPVALRHVIETLDERGAR
jgi:hypothetical protein